MNIEILIGNEARDFFHSALMELDHVPKPEDRKFINKECGGYWEEECNGKMIWWAFDNSSCGMLTVEEFDEVEEAIKYAKGIEAKTRDGSFI